MVGGRGSNAIVFVVVIIVVFMFVGSNLLLDSMLELAASAAVFDEGLGPGVLSSILLGVRSIFQVVVADDEEETGMLGLVGLLVDAFVLVDGGGKGGEGVKIQEQTDEISDGLSQFETKDGRLVVAVLIVVV